MSGSEKNPVINTSIPATLGSDGSDNVEICMVRYAFTGKCSKKGKRRKKVIQLVSPKDDYCSWTVENNYICVSSIPTESTPDTAPEASGNHTKREPSVTVDLGVTKTVSILLTSR